MATVNFYLKQRADKKGQRLIVLVQQAKGQKLNRSTGIKVPTNAWDSNKQRIKPHHPNATQLNGILARQKQKAEQVWLELRMAEQPLEISSIRKQQSAEAALHAPLVQKLDEFKQQFISSRSPDFHHKYEALKQHWSQFETQSQTKFSVQAVTPATIQKFTNFLLESVGNTNQTVGKKLQFLKTFLRWAADQGAELDPKVLKASLPKQSRVLHLALTAEELGQIQMADFSTQSALERVRDVFCFGCLTGLRYSDIQNLKPEDIIELKDDEGKPYKAVRLIMIKTRDIVQIPLREEAMRILERYEFRLPVISNQKTNVQLKEMAEQAGLNTPFVKVFYRGSQRIEVREPKHQFISTHTARRTFATLAVLNGMNLFALQRILGHSSIQQTMEYVHETSGGLTQAMLKGMGR